MLIVVHSPLRYHYPISCRLSIVVRIDLHRSECVVCASCVRTMWLCEVRGTGAIREFLAVDGQGYQLLYEV